MIDDGDYTLIIDITVNNIRSQICFLGFMFLSFFYELKTFTIFLFYLHLLLHNV